MAKPFTVIALISAFNEGDIIDFAIGHLVDNGVDVYLLDNHSTDDTLERASPWLGRGLLEIESFPAAKHTAAVYDWTAILQRKEELAAELDADWFMHHDADEFRESPWPGTTLKDAIQWVDRAGYNCIDYQILNFRPIDDGFRSGHDPREYFQYFEEAAEFDKMQLKTWKATRERVSLAASGGHQAYFEGRRIFPVPFLLRHYPIRGQTHGARKVFAERKRRFLEQEQSKGWHRQYEHIADEGHQFIRDPAELRRFDLEQVRLEAMLPDALLRSLKDRLLRSDADFEAYRVHTDGMLEGFRRHVANLQVEHDTAIEHASNVEKRMVEIGRQTDEPAGLRQLANLETERNALKQHAANLEAERNTFEQHAANLKTERNALKQHAANLETERNALKQHAANLDAERVAAHAHIDDLNEKLASLTAQLRAMQDQIAAAETRNAQTQAMYDSATSALQRIESELAAMRGSRSWRWTAPLRRLFGDK